MIKNLLFIGLTFFRLCFYAQNFSITYGFPDVTTSSGAVDPSLSPTLGGLTFGSFSAHGTSSNPSASGRFSFTDWPLGGVNATDDYSNFTGVLSPTVYYEITIAVDPGYTLSINTLTFSVRRSGTGVRNYCVRSDLDSYTNNLAANTGTASKLSVIPGNVFFWSYDSVSTSSDQKGSTVLTGSQFTTITGSVSFRFYAWNAESSGGSFAIDNVTFMGSVADTIAVPVGLPAGPVKIKGTRVYPCPSKNGKIKIESEYKQKRFEIVSLYGCKVMEEPAWENEITELDLSGLENGIYFLRSEMENTFQVTRIVLMHN